ncbi:G patch domain-containing protein 4-like [Lineus longissimus]|uniref:G patch domain-containing protein 4-like n=1 Tax=Lineus longissimus TaxID=88925 RepID=UPI002B4DAB30
MATGLGFARAQLEKSGWTEGSGLGRQESGITEAIKVKIKTDNKGVGHNAGDEFTFRWWDHAFNKAASNIKVDDTEAGISVKMAEESGPLSSKRPDTQKMLNSKSLLYGRFVKSSTVMKDGIEEKRQTEADETSESSEEENLDRSSKRTDEEMFRLCGGRTAHKGARHGLGANGKLSRVEKSEQDLLKRMRKTLHEQREKEAKRERYGNTSSAVIRGKTKKMKNCYESESSSSDSESEDEAVDLKSNKSGLKLSDDGGLNSSGSCESDAGLSVIKGRKKLRKSGDGSDVVNENGVVAKDRKRKKSKRNETLEMEKPGVDSVTEVVTKKKKKNGSRNVEEVVMDDVVDCEKKSKKVKRKDKSGCDGELETVDTEQDCNLSGKKKSRRKSPTDSEEVLTVVAQKKSKKDKKIIGNGIENGDLGDGDCIKKPKRKRKVDNAGEDEGVGSDVEDVKRKKKKKKSIKGEVDVDCGVKKSKKKKLKK